MHKWPRSEQILFVERLESYVSSGLSLDRSLQIIEHDGDKNQCKTLRNMRKAVEAGRSLADSLTGSAGLPPTAVGLIRHGESSGRLAESLSAVRAMLEHGEELRKRLGGAMTYPVVIGVFALLLTLGLVRGVMPQIIPMLLSLHVPLPLLTRIVIGLSQGLTHYGMYGLIGGISVIVASATIYRKSIRARNILQNVFIQIPIIGHLYVNYAIAIFLQSCGSLIETGSPAGASYAKSAASISLIPVKKIFELKNNDLNRGEPVHKAFRDKIVPRFISSLLAAGEISGTLGASMIRSSAILDKNIDHSLKRLTSLVEPIMMIGMGLVVGSIALSIMMPIYDISKVLQK